MKEGSIIKVAGPLVVAKGLAGTNIYDLVRVGEQRLLGEVVEIHSEEYSLQVYEETEGIGPGDAVYPMGEPFSVELGPGLIGSIFDGIQRPLDLIASKLGSYIVRGAEFKPLDRAKKWHFVPARKAGEDVRLGDVLGTVRETVLVEHRIMVPPGVEGRIITTGEDVYTVDEVVAEIETSDGVVGIKMLQKWPVRQLRPVAKKLPPDEPLVTGQRVIDTFFPVAKGGTSCVPGPFGSGKTVVQHQLAKWSDADIIVYVGCGERGNEMADVLLSFPGLKDPKSHEPLMERTVLVANTSNMPVAAREASVFTGTTIAEYYRDMGYNVALMADSTSRWAEAMREISCRLEEMPGEEGFPTYLGSRLAGFYERSGNVVCLGRDVEGKEGRRGSLSIIGAVSPPGGDLSEPVAQATLRAVKVFWGLDDRLASQRHFPAINWLTSYSLYQRMVDKYTAEKIGPGWDENRVKALRLLHRESELEELVRLVGMESLSPEDKLIMEIAKMIREDFLHQNAYDELDTYTSLEKQFYMLDVILKFYSEAREAIDSGVGLEQVMEIPVRDNIPDLRLATEGDTKVFEQMQRDIESQIGKLVGGGEFGI